MNQREHAKSLLSEKLPQLLDCSMQIQIKDLAEDAEAQSAPVIQRHLAKWEITPEEEHVRLYFNPCQFVAVPIDKGPLTLTEERGRILLKLADPRGNLLYLVSFSVDKSLQVP